MRKQTTVFCILVYQNEYLPPKSNKLEQTCTCASIKLKNPQTQEKHRRKVREAHIKDNKGLKLKRSK